MKHLAYTTRRPYSGTISSLCFRVFPYGRKDGLAKRANVMIGASTAPRGRDSLARRESALTLGEGGAGEGEGGAMSWRLFFEPMIMMVRPPPW